MQNPPVNRGPEPQAGNAPECTIQNGNGRRAGPNPKIQGRKK